MALDLTVFVAVAPEYATLSVGEQSRRDTLATVAETEISESIFGSKYDLAIALLTAHWMKQGDMGGAGGLLTQEKVGDLSRTYQQPSLEATDLDSTSYGTQFKRIRRQVLVIPNVY